MLPAPRPAWQMAAAGLTLTVFSTAQSLLVEWAKKTHGGKIPFHTPSAVLYTELLKLVVSSAIWFRQRPSLEYTGLERWRALTCVAYAVPAVMFTIQNNLAYVAMSLLDPPTFQLWACWKLIPAGLFARCMLRQRLTRVQWVALVLLALGMATTKLTSHGGHGSWRHYQGIGILLINGCLSGASGVTNEYLIKLSDPRAPLMFKNMHIYFFCLLAATPTYRPSEGSWDALALLIVAVNAATGLCISLVLK